MRKVMSFCLAICIFLSLPVLAYAQAPSTDYAQGIPVDPSQIADVPCLDVVPLDINRLTRSVQFTSQFDFYGVNPNILIPDTKAFQIADRTSIILRINSCTWTPVYYDIEVGLWNMTNNRYYYGTMLYGGHGSEHVQFHNLPGGSYRICVYNRGQDVLQTGTIACTI